MLVNMCQDFSRERERVGWELDVLEREMYNLFCKLHFSPNVKHYTYVCLNGKAVKSPP